MLITIDFLVLMPLIILSFGSLAFVLMFFYQLKLYAPEAFVFRSARLKRVGLVCTHNANGTCEYEVPKQDGDRDTGHFFVKGGRYKFKDVTGTRVERLSGNLPVTHVMDNMMEPISALLASHISAVADELGKAGYSIQGIEQIFYDVLREVFRKQDLVKYKGRAWRDLSLNEQIEELLERLEVRLSEINVNDEVTRGKLRVIIPYIMRNRTELENAVNNMHFRPFSWQEIIRTFDDYVAFTSNNFNAAKLNIEADAKSGHNLRDYMPVLVIGFAAFLVLVGVYFVTK